MRDPQPAEQYEVHVESDTVISAPAGVVSLAEAKQLLACLDEVIARHGYCLLMSNSARFKTVTADARQFSAKWITGKPLLGIAVYNASFTARTLFSLIMKGINLLNPRAIPLTFVREESEARAWLAERRRGQLDRNARSQGPDPQSPASSTPSP